MCVFLIKELVKDSNTDSTRVTGFIKSQYIFKNWGYHQLSRVMMQIYNDLYIEVVDVIVYGGKFLKKCTKKKSKESV